jgi:regulator of cell morphogenesis and NO signaling
MQIKYKKEDPMNTPQVSDTVGDVVARFPTLSRVFEEAGIDFCCGGQKTLEEVCREKGLDSRSFLATLEESALASAGESVVDVVAMSLTELVDHIEQTHHKYLRSEFPRLDSMTEKVASVHGEKNSSLHQIRETFLALVAELSSHLMEEEQILFPMVRQLEASETALTFHRGSLANSIGQMESEHIQAGLALEKLRELADGYTLPDWGCNTYRAMLDALVHLEHDIHLHIHKENSVLFPRTLEMESEKNK